MDFTSATPPCAARPAPSFAGNKMSMKRFLCFALFAALSGFGGAGCSRAAAPGVADSSNAAPKVEPAPEPVTGTFEVKPPIPAPTPTPTPSKGVLRLPAPPVRRAVRDAQINAIKNKLARYPTSAGFRRLAERSVQLGLFAEAALAFRAEAAIYRKRGLADAALIIKTKPRATTPICAFSSSARRLRAR